MPLGQIQTPVTDSPALLDRYWPGLQRERQEEESLIASLKDCFSQKEPQMFEIRERTVPQVQVIGRRGRADLGALPEFIAATFQQLQQHLAAQDARARSASSRPGCAGPGHDRAGRAGLPGGLRHADGRATGRSAGGPGRAR